MKRHISNVHCKEMKVQKRRVQENKTYGCDHCSKTFTKNSNVKRHITNVHGKEKQMQNQVSITRCKNEKSFSTEINS